MATAIDAAPVLLLAPAPSINPSAPTRTPWAWIVVTAGIFLLLALVAAILIYERDRRRTQHTGDVTVEPLVPIGRQLAPGAYRMRWAPTGLYLGVDQSGAVALLPVSQATTWTFTPASTPGSLGGSLNTPNGLYLYASGSGSSLAAGAVQSGSSLPPGAFWVPATETSGQAIVPGTLHSAALGGCARPSGTVDSSLVLSATCGTAERGWYFEAAK